MELTRFKVVFISLAAMLLVLMLSVAGLGGYVVWSLGGFPDAKTRLLELKYLPAQQARLSALEERIGGRNYSPSLMGTVGPGVEYEVYNLQADVDKLDNTVYGAGVLVDVGLVRWRD